MRWLCAVTLVLWAAESKDEVFSAHGYRGGYFLMSKRGYRWSLDEVFKLLNAVPAYKGVWEVEPNRLERAVIGEQIACERCCRTKPVVGAWSFRAFKNGIGAPRSHEAARGTLGG